MKQLEVLKFCKGMAIIGIVAYHYLAVLNLPPAIDKAVGYGGSAVHLFFFLSGAGLVLGYTGNIVRFYRKRLIRIHEPYMVMILAIFSINLVVDYGTLITPAALAGQLLLYRMFIASIYYSFQFEYWFFATLIQLYILFPLLYGWIRRHARIFVSVSALASISWWVMLVFLKRAGMGVNGPVDNLFLKYLWEFALGMAVADAYRQGRLQLRVRGGMVLVLFVGATAASFVMTFRVPYGTFFNDPFNFLSFTALTLTAHTVLGAVWRPAVRAMSFIGNYTLSIYLVHMFVLQLYLIAFDLKNLTFAHLPVAVGMLALAVMAFEAVCARLPFYRYLTTTSS